MHERIKLNVVHGKLKGESYTFDERALCIVGRALDCNIKIPDDKENRTISRYHCLLDINPPDIRVRDFGSRNGTFVNDRKIGQREADEAPDAVERHTGPEVDLMDGDRVTIGNTVFQVSIELVTGEEAELPEADADAASEPLETQRPLLLERDAEVVAAPEIRIEGLALERELGVGGMGKVYLARDEASGAEVAVKIMLPQVSVNPRSRAMFLREARTTQALEHPNVVRCLRSGCVEDTFYFVLEYCNRGGVDQLAEARGGKLPVDEALEIILQALDGLEYAHTLEIAMPHPSDALDVVARGFVHRDFKPGNIYLHETAGRRLAKVGDFGLSKAFDLAGLSGQTATGTTAGTPVFMPRQQILNYKYVKPEVDVWATAASFYHLVTGTTPRDFPPEEDPWLTALKTKPTPIRKREPSVPARLAAVIDAALIDNPELEFKSAAALKAALEAAR